MRKHNKRQHLGVFAPLFICFIGLKGLRDVVDVAGTARTWLRKQLMWIVGKTMPCHLHHPFGNCLYHLFVVIWGMVYYCFTHNYNFNHLLYINLQKIDPNDPDLQFPPLPQLVTQLPTHLDQAPRRFPCLKALCKDLQWNTCATAGPSARLAWGSWEPTVAKPTSMQDDEYKCVSEVCNLPMECDIKGYKKRWLLDYTWSFGSIWWFYTNLKHTQMLYA